MSKHGSTDLIESTLKVMTWNVWWRYGPWQQRRPAIEETLADVDADLVALQEVWGDDDTDLAAELARTRGYHAVFESRLARDGVRFGNGFLSRWPVTRVDTRALPAAEGRDEERLIVSVEIAGPRGRIRAFCTHLNWRAHDSAIRQLQVAELARFVSATGAADFVPIVCGDFNAVSDSDEIRMMTGRTTCPVDGLVFRDAWADVGRGGAGYTWDNENPHAAAELEANHRIDYIFTGEPLDNGAGHVTRCEVAGNRPIDGVWPSDHFGLVAELRY